MLHPHTKVTLNVRQYTFILLRHAHLNRPSLPAGVFGTTDLTYMGWLPWKLSQPPTMENPSVPFVVLSSVMVRTTWHMLKKGSFIEFSFQNIYLSQWVKLTGTILSPYCFCVWRYLLSLAKKIKLLCLPDDFWVIWFPEIFMIHTIWEIWVNLAQILKNIGIHPLIQASVAIDTFEHSSRVSCQKGLICHV